MRDRRRSRILLAVLVLVALLVLTVDYRLGDGGMISALQRGVVAVLGPVQEGLSAVTRPFASVGGEVADLWRLRSENRELREELEAERTARRSVEDLERELGDLRAQLDMRDELGLRTVGAQVIARPPAAFDWSVLLDVGRDHGVEPGMAVVDQGGLVGRVTEVASGNSRVQLVTSPSAGYGVRVAETGVEGLLSGQAADPLRMEVIDPEVAVEAEQEVVTRPFAGSRVPAGLPVGRTAAGLDPEEAAVRTVPVHPFADFTRLGVVQVVLTAPDHPDDLDGDDVDTLAEAAAGADGGGG